MCETGSCFRKYITPLLPLGCSAWSSFGQVVLLVTKGTANKLLLLIGHLQTGAVRHLWEGRLRRVGVLSLFMESPGSLVPVALLAAVSSGNCHCCRAKHGKKTTSVLCSLCQRRRRFSTLVPPGCQSGDSQHMWLGRLEVGPKVDSLLLAAASFHQKHIATNSMSCFMVTLRRLKEL